MLAMKALVNHNFSCINVSLYGMIHAFFQESKQLGENPSEFSDDQVITEFFYGTRVKNLIKNTYKPPRTLCIHTICIALCFFR